MAQFTGQGPFGTFAAVIRNFPGDQTKVPLKLTSKGKKLARTLVMQGKKKLRGPMRITNATRGIDIIPLTVRLKKPDGLAALSRNPPSGKGGR